MFGEDRLVIMLCMLENMEGDRRGLVKFKCIFRITTHTILKSVSQDTVPICGNNLDISMSPAVDILYFSPYI